MKKRLLRGFLILVGLAAVAVAALLLRFPPDTWKDRALAELEARTGIRATAQEASVSFFPLGLALQTVALEDDRPDQPYRELTARIDAVVVRAELMSLVRGAPQVNEIRLTRPEVRVTMAAPSETNKGGATAQPVEAAAVLALLAIDEGSLAVLGHDGAETHLLDFTQRGGLHLDRDGSYQGNVQGSVGVVRLVAAGTGDATEVPPLEFALRMEGATRPPRGTVHLGWLKSAGLRLEGPVEYDLSGETLQVDARLDCTLDVASLFSTFRGQLALSGLLQDAEIQHGSVTGVLTYAGPLPDLELDPFAWLDSLSGSGTLQDLRLATLGQPVEVAAAGWSLADRKLRLTDVRATGAGMQLQGRATLPATGVGAMDSEWAVDADLADLRAAAASVWPRLPAEQTADQLPVEEWPALTGRAHGTLTLAAVWPDPTAGATEAVPPDFGGTLTLEAASLKAPGWGSAVKVATGQLKVAPELVTFTRVEFSGDGFSGTADGTASGWPEQILVETQAHFARLDVDRAQAVFVPPVETAALSWAVRPAWAADVEPWIPPENLVVDATVTAASVSAEGYTFTDVAGEGRLERRKLAVPQVTGALQGGAVVGKASVDWTQEVPRWTANASSDDVPAAALLAPVAEPLARSISSRLKGTLNLSGAVGEPAAVQASLSGDGNVRASGGEFLTEPLLGDAVDKFLGAFAPQFKTLDFRDVSGALRFENGNVRFDNLILDGPTSVRAGGWVSLDGKRCETRLTVTLPAGVTPSLGALAPVADLLRDDAGRLPFDLLLTGPAAKPKVQVDLAQLADRAQARGASDLKDRLGGLLPPGLGNAAADSLKGQLQEEAKEGLNDLLGRFRRKK